MESEECVGKRSLTFIDFFADETWLDVVGYEGKYKVSNKGNVWSVSRIVRIGGKTGTVKTKDMLMKQVCDEKGYMRVCLNDTNGKTKRVTVHRLVAMAFLPNELGKPQVNHIDGDKKNNNVNNLEWCTNGENQKHAYRLGLNRVTGRAGRKKKRVRQIDIDSGEIVNEFASLNDAGRQTGIFPQNIRKVVVGERTKAGGYRWEVV